MWRFRTQDFKSADCRSTKTVTTRDARVIARLAEKIWRRNHNSPKENVVIAAMNSTEIGIAVKNARTRSETARLAALCTDNNAPINNHVMRNGEVVIFRP